ncbi:hypothetical protein [Streptomyces yanii]|uniref:Uncharacterized protein n=1 Tax=Streptomyces yanii TaxID=78510 RepID=A0ABV5RCI1_9ACTN
MSETIVETQAVEVPVVVPAVETVSDDQLPGCWSTGPGPRDCS